MPTCRASAYVGVTAQHSRALSILVAAQVYSGQGDMEHAESLFRAAWGMAVELKEPTFAAFALRSLVRLCVIPRAVCVVSVLPLL